MRALVVTVLPSDGAVVVVPIHIAQGSRATGETALVAAFHDVQADRLVPGHCVLHLLAPLHCCSFATVYAIVIDAAADRYSYDTVDCIFCTDTCPLFDAECADDAADGFCACSVLRIDCKQIRWTIVGRYDAVRAVSLDDR